ncbi:phthiocerol/phenolphthiocerol synthesis polyketide synthase type I PpsD-like [Folsomia candida]|uniref:phthiocerol/phenolphthiocerol synthesis polyketide synthase type I PpsD-like n=1 Tax=Folsomia candida TaxID=158441 RepID=UPI0016055D5F|nr:phthiocerol/phenolphthiocerol synthesis polyketide synthase type I PpsD-like [Folsomia candida]
MGKEAYATFVRNEVELEDALILLKSIKETKSFKKVLVLFDSGNLEIGSWKKLANQFDDMVQLISFPGLKVDFWSQLMLTCSTLLDFDRICLIEPSALVLKNADSLFSHDPAKIVFGPGLFILQPGTNASEYLFDYLKNELESEPTFHKLKDVLINESRAVYFKKQFLADLKNPEFSLEPPTKIVFLGESIHETTDRVKDLFDFRNKIKLLPYSKSESTAEPIAVIGISCRMPDSNGVNEYWKTFLDGKCVIRPHPEGRWMSEQIGTSDKGKIECGFLPCPVEEFDGDFFEMSPAECNFTDPQQRFLLEVSWEALEDAGINPQSLAGTMTGIYSGCWAQDYLDLIKTFAPRPTGDLRWYMGSGFASGSARLAHIYKVRGPSLTAEVACSSSFVAVGQAVQDLRRGASNLAIATGANLIIKPTFQNDVVLSKDHRCKTFDSAANGFTRSEGIAALILKRLSDAVRDRDRIHSVIMGYGATQDGETKSVGTPTIEMEALAMGLALRDAGMKPEQIQVVEAHGTGTAKGDPLEIKAISKSYSTSDRADPLIITAGKANIGHSESASGIAGLIKITMAMKHGLIPVQIGIQTLNPEIDLTTIPAIIPLAGSMPWCPAFDTPKVAGISSFGFTGTNTHIILQEAPKSIYIENTTDSTMQRNIITLSAKSEEALSQLVHNYKTHLSSNTHMRLDDIAYTANIGRAKFSNRVAITARNNEELVQKLDTKNWSSGTTQKEPNICFLFPGQGTQYSGMGRQLYDTFPVFREHFDLCFQLILNMYGLNIKHALYGEKIPNGHLKQTLYAQWSIFVIEYCLLKLWASLGVHPSIVIGHSLGEFAAATAASLITLEDAIKIIGKRCKLVETLPAGKMLAAGTDSDTCTALIARFLKERPTTNADWLDIAAYNSKQQTTISGPSVTIDEFAIFCVNNGVRTAILDASHPFHSRALDSIINKFKDSLVTLNQTAETPTCKFISCVDGTHKATITSEYWISNLRESVQFLQATETIEKQIQRDDSGRQYIFLEIGPHPVLSSLLRSNLAFAPQCIKSMRRGGNELEVFLDALGSLFVHGVSVDFGNFHRVHHTNKVSLPFYPFQRKSFWFPFQSDETHDCPSTIKDMVHPLLGRRVEQPEKSEISVERFENIISTESNQWIGDHCIGQNAMMPAAGFLEMTLASRYLTLVDNDTRNFTIDNFSIQNPGFLGKKGSIYHTVLEGAMVKIFSQVDTGVWILHSQGTINESWSKDGNGSKDALPLFERDITPPSSSRVVPYEKLTSDGYNFGPCFQCITSVWEDQNLNKCAKGNIDPAIVDGRFILHPVILDSMLQFFIMSIENPSPPGTIGLPVTIRRLSVYNMNQDNQPTDLPSQFYLKKCRQSEIIHLYNSVGKPLASLEGIDLISTTLSSLDEKPQSSLNRTRQCPLFELEWRKDLISAPTTKLISSDGAPKHRTWLIFGLDDTFTKDLIRQLSIAGETVVLITIGSGEIMTTEYIETMGDSKEAFLNIFSQFPESEGVIFAWGMKSVFDHSIIEKWFYLLQAIALSPMHLSKLLLLTQGMQCVSINAEQAEKKPSAALLGGMMRSFKSENSMLTCKLIDLDFFNHENVENIIHEINENPNAASSGNCICYKDGVRLSQKLMELKPSNFLQLPNTARFRIQLPTSNLVSDLKFIDMQPAVNLGDNELEIKVSAYSLNFRDIFAVLKPSEAFKKEDIVGTDFSGVICRTGNSVDKYQVGDMVFGVHAQNVAISSHVTTSENMVCTLPQFLTHEEASTLPTVGLTVYLCLQIIANMKKGDTILVHAASGGVGLAAVQVANRVGANVIATAGSPRKRAYLKHIIGIKHVFNSRNLSFESDVNSATDRAGVDIVLNSLTGPGFKEASLNCLRKGGRFIEMSKINIWTEEECLSLRPDVKYSIEDVRCSVENSTLISHLKNATTELLQPIPYIRFHSQQIIDAMHFLEKAKHVGKVVVSMPGRDNTLFSDKSSYLITGGLGGIGWELMKWMLLSGANRIILMSRSIPTLERQDEINDLQNRGYNVIWRRGDVSELSDCESVFSWIKEQFPQSPLRGIFHCAGVLSDAAFVNQTKESLDKVLNPKFHGGWNLHELSKHLDLQHFVLFSSISSLIGTPGQGNYAAANAFLDALSHYRYALGLPAISLNFGHWAEVGLAAGQHISGLHPMSTKQALDALEIALKSNSNQLCPVAMNVPKLMQRIPWIENFLLNILDSEGSQKRKMDLIKKVELVTTEMFWVELEACNGKIDRCSVIRNHIERMISSVLQLEPNSGINRKFSELGLDSLMMIEIKNQISTLLGPNVQMSLNEFADSEDLDSLVNFISKLVESKDSPKQVDI